MRLSDLTDYLELRRHLARPWEFLRLRRRLPPGQLLEVPLRGGRAVRLRTGTLDRHILSRVFARDEYRLREAGRLDTVVDGGAHIGLFSLRAAGVARRVLAYEPHPANFALLLENVRGLAAVEPHLAALAARPGPRALVPSAEPAAHRLAAGPQAPGSLEARCTSLEEVFAGERLERLDFLKLDVEGAEYEVLAAAPAALLRRIRRIALEYHAPPPGEEAWTPRRLAQRLEEAGHQVNLRPSARNPTQGRLFAALR